MKSKIYVIIVLMIVLCAGILNAQETKIINGYKVTRGERPTIDLSKVPVDAYESGKISIKLSHEMEKFIKDDVILSSLKGEFVKTGVEKIDKLNETLKVTQIKPKQYGFYKISPASVKYRERHKAWGFHLWMEITLPEDADIIEAVKSYMALSEVEIAEPFYKTVLYESVDPKDFFPNGNEKSDPKLTVNDTQYDEQWHYHNTGQQGGTVDCDIDLSEAWDIERGSSEVLIAVQDMGIEINHPDLNAHIWSGIGYDFQGMDSNSGRSEI